MYITEGYTTTTTISATAEVTSLTQPAITASVTSQEGMATTGTYSIMTTQLPPTLDQNTDIQHHSFVVIAGDSLSLHCSSTVEAKFRWGYYRFGSSVPTNIYNGKTINPTFHLADKVSVNDSNGKTCTFDMNDFQLDDAGVFVCIWLGVNEYWSITVLGKCIVY